MGWLYKHDPIDDPVAYLIDQFNTKRTRLYDVLDAARVANTVYMAVECTDKATGNAFVLAAVILISNTRKHGFGYKDMDETMGPYSGAPVPTGSCACCRRSPTSPIRATPPSGAPAWPRTGKSWRNSGGSARVYGLAAS